LEVSGLLVISYYFIRLAGMNGKRFAPGFTEGTITQRQAQRLPVCACLAINVTGPGLAA
jgi:hypothetical protein